MPKDNLTCEGYGKKFTRTSNLHCHRITTDNVKSFCCSTCGRCFNGRIIINNIQEIMLEIHFMDRKRGMILSY